MIVARLILIFILIVAPFSIFAQKVLQPKSVIITGRVINSLASDANVIVINYCEPISSDNRKAVRLSPSGEFYSKYDMHFSQNITIKYNDDFINVFVNPTDSIDITIDMSRFREGDWDGLVFSGDGAKINNQFAKFNNYLLKLPKENLNFNLPANEFIKEIKNALAISEDSITVYAKRNKLDPFIIKWAKRNIVYSLANRILDYSRNDRKQQLEVLLDPIFDMNNPKNFQSAMFQFYLFNTLSPILIQDEEFSKFKKSSDIVNQALVAINAIVKLLKSTSRDYLIYVVTVEAIQTNPDLYDKLPKKIFSNKIFDDKLKSLSLKYISTNIDIKPINEVAYLDGDSIKLLGEQEIFKYLADKYKNKVIYIDIWNTSCGPCIAQFVDAKELHRLYANNDVVFVNICLSSTTESWLSVINSKKIEGKNYFLDNDNSALFMDMCNLPGYPTYMLMDKTGTLVNKNAPQPQNLSKISELIDALLK